MVALQDVHERCRGAAEQRDPDAYFCANEAFHGALYAASHNAFLCEQAQALQRKLQPYRRLQLRVRNRVQRSFEEHQGIVDALRQATWSWPSARCATMWWCRASASPTCWPACSRWRCPKPTTDPQPRTDPHHDHALRLDQPLPDPAQPADGAQRGRHLASPGLAGGVAHAAGRGNAVDAAISAAAALTIVEPVSNGLGSDNFAILWDGAQLHGLNASGVAPAAWNPDYFRRKHGQAMPMRGWDTVTTPGAVAGWVALSERFGKLPFADLLAPAIELAERGHGVACIVADKWRRATPLLQDQPGFAEAFMPRGRAPEPGERFRLCRRRRHAAPDRADQGRGLLPRRDRRDTGGACRRPRRQHDAGRPGRLSGPSG